MKCFRSFSIECSPFVFSTPTSSSSKKNETLKKQIYGAGVALTGLATIPNWPWLNRNPLTWLPVEEKEEEEKEDEGEEDGKEDDDNDDGNEGTEKNNSSPSRKTTTRRAATQRRQPVVE